MRTLNLILAVSLIALASCDFVSNEHSKTRNETPTPSNAATPANDAKDPAAGGGQAIPEKTSVAAADCQSVDAGDNIVLKKQTFPIDFEPFKGSCFVTAHNPEYDDPPMESEIAIYTDGKKTFDFPSQFNGTTFGCWVEAVSFQDLSADLLTDIIVVGKCSAKASPYYENVVYVNTGKAFTTNEEANMKLSGFGTAREVVDFVKVNREMFFK